MRRLMTLDDLYNYYSTQGKSLKFSCENEESIVVQVPGNLKFEKDSAPTDGLYPTKLKMCFIGDNLNGSRIEKKAMSNALSSAKFRPILGFIHEVDGEPQFYGHNMHMDDDKLVYDEVPVGVIIEEASLEYDEDNKKEYAVANGYIYEEYSSAADILKRDNQCDVSVELSIRELSFNAEDKILCLDDFYFSGCTVLGVDEFGNKVNPAMPGSNISLSDFSVQNNSFCASVDQNKLIDTLEKLNTTLSNFNIDSLRKEDTKVDQNETFEEVAETEEVLVTEEATEEEAAAEEVISEDATEVTPESEVEVTEEFTEEESETVEETEEVETEVEEPQEEVKEIEFSITHEGEVKTFSISLNDKLNAIYSLVNETYGEIDNDFYDVVFYDDTNVIEMHGLFSGKSYRQSCKKKKCSYTLVGDRVEIFSVWMSSDEKEAFESMKSNYSSISEKLQKYEEEPQKMEILGSAKYGYVSGTEEFESLKNEHFDLSIEDVTNKANEILLSYAEAGALKFSVQDEEESNVTRKTFIPSKTSTTPSRYGSLFSK